MTTHTQGDAATTITDLAVLAEPVRRKLFHFVTQSREAVSREQAATGIGIPVHTAKFHLDRLVEAGLLEATFKRLSGKTGPGSGRPSKLYRQTSREISVSVPERHYDLLSRILARAVSEAQSESVPVTDIAARFAREEGIAWGERSPLAFGSSEIEHLAQLLSREGYQPWIENETLYLSNCPFHRVAQEQTELVCGLNLALITGVTEGAGCNGLNTQLDPAAGRCCVSATAHPGCG